MIGMIATPIPISASIRYAANRVPQAAYGPNGLTPGWP